MDLIIPNLGKNREPCFLVGIHSDLARWVHSGRSDRKSLAHKALMAKGVSEQSVMEVLGLQNPLDRRLKASGVIEALWKHHPELGPCPILDTLLALEDERAFYRDYREHACLHQLLVYLLGIYVFSQNGFVQGAFREEIRQEGVLSNPADEEVLDEEFLRRWLVAATAHDVGYVLESVEADPSQSAPVHWDKVRLSVQDLFANALSRVGKIAEIMPTAWESQWKNDANVHTPEVNTPEFLLGLGRLEELDKVAVVVGMGARDDRDLCKRYYEFARSNAPKDRSQYRDHGITSACLVRAIFDSYHERVEKVITYPSVPPDLRNVLTRIQGKRREAQATITAACGAIVLHNLDPDLWESKSKEGGAALQQARLFPSKLRFRLDKAALAFLLRFCDGLQEWGRPEFRPRREDDQRRELQAHDISIRGAVDGAKPLRIFLRKSKDPDGAVMPGSKRFAAFKNDAWRYLEEGHLKRMASFAGDASAKLRLADWEGEDMLRTGKPTHNTEAEDSVSPMRFSNEEKQVIRGLVGPRAVPEDEIVHCPKNGNCHLRRHSIVTVAELARVGTAHDQTVKVWEFIKNLERQAGHVRRIVAESKNDAVLQHYFDTMQAMIMLLLRHFEAEVKWENLRSRQKTRNLRNFLSRRVPNADKSIVDGFVDSLHSLYEEFKDAGDEDLVEKLRHLNAHEAVSTLHEKSKQMDMYLKEVIRSRTSGTYDTIKTEFGRCFNGKELGSHFMNVNRSFPHQKDGNDHLRISQ